LLQNRVVFGAELPGTALPVLPAAAAAAAAVAPKVMCQHASSAEEQHAPFHIHSRHL
jgi:hypothetical protein